MKIRNGASLEDVKNNSIDVGRNHRHHLQPDESRTDDTAGLGDRLSFLIGHFEQRKLLGNTSDGLAVDVSHLMDEFVIVEWTKTFGGCIFQHFGIKNCLEVLVAGVANGIEGPD